jgi:hypothetical protein
VDLLGRLIDPEEPDHPQKLEMMSKISSKTAKSADKDSIKEVRTAMNQY